MAEVPPSYTLNRHRFCVAVHHSSSTHGSILRSERDVVDQLCALQPFYRKYPVLTTLLPWKNQSPKTIPVSTIRHDHFSYVPTPDATDPSSIYLNESYVKALHGCSVWFLLTDGEIHDKEIDAFRNNTSKLGLYDTKCVVVVFGSAAEAHPAAVNSSIGMSTCALAPNSLFLFHDYPTGAVYLLQAKGCFEVLLPSGGKHPTVDNHLRWPQVHRTTYQDVVNVVMPSRFGPDTVNSERPVIRQRDAFDSIKEQAPEPQSYTKATSSVSISEAPGEIKSQVSNSRNKHSNVANMTLPMRPKEGPGTAAALILLEKVLQCLAVNSPEDELNTYRLQLNATRRANTPAPHRAAAEHVKPRKRTWAADETRSETTERLSAKEPITGDGASEEEGEDDVNSRRSSKIARTTMSGLREGQVNMMKVSLRPAKNYTAAIDQDVTTSTAHSADVSGGILGEEFRHRRPESIPFSVNGPPESRTTPEPRLSFPYRPFKPQYLPHTVSRSTVGEITSSSFVSTIVGLDHPPQFQGKCDLCLHEDTLSLLMIADSTAAISLASPSRKSKNMEFNNNAMAEIRLSDLFWDQACCATCVSCLVAPNANLFPGNIRSPNGEFKLRSDDVTKELWVAGLQDLCHGYVMHEQVEEFFHAVFNWKHNVLAIQELKNSSFKHALLWMRDELQAGVEMLETSRMV